MMNSMNTTPRSGMPPLVAHMQRFSLHDGPGIRTTVFLKGCPLRCPWCCNAECVRPGVELAFQKQLCLGMEACGRCAAACPRRCFQRVDEKPFPSGKMPVLNRQHCDLCMACAAACPAGALARVGEALTAQDIVEFCRQDAEIFALSGGGITLSGGEPLFRPALTAEVLRLARAEGMHSALETCGWFDMDDPQAREALSCLDLCIVDLKHVDSEPHQRHTGVDVQRIHCNLLRLAREFPRLPLTARITLIPGFNAVEDVVLRLARLALSVPTVRRVDLVPGHVFGVAKYMQLGRPQLWTPASACAEEWVQALREKVARLAPASTPAEVPHAVSA